MDALRDRLNLRTYGLQGMLDGKYGEKFLFNGIYKNKSFNNWSYRF